MFAFPGAVVSKQTPKPGIIPQHGIEEAMRHFISLSIDQPSRVGFCADRLPHFLVQIVGSRFVEGVVKNDAKDVRFDACVIVPCSQAEQLAD